MVMELLMALSSGITPGLLKEPYLMLEINPQLALSKANTLHAVFILESLYILLNTSVDPKGQLSLRTTVLLGCWVLELLLIGKRLPLEQVL